MCAPIAAALTPLRPVILHEGEGAANLPPPLKINFSPPPLGVGWQ
jgi:hypothetical protein